jgi:hypothetical protein
MRNPDIRGLSIPTILIHAFTRSPWPTSPPAIARPSAHFAHNITYAFGLTLDYRDPFGIEALKRFIHVLV